MEFFHQVRGMDTGDRFPSAFFRAIDFPVHQIVWAEVCLSRIEDGMYFL